MRELPQIQVESMDLFPNKDEGQLRIAKSNSMFLSLNIDQKIACFESLKEQESNSENQICSTNSQSENLDIGDLFMKKTLIKDDINSIHSGSIEEL